jgi:Pancreatic hormone peptide
MADTGRHRSSQHAPILTTSSRPIAIVLTAILGLLLLLLDGPTSVNAAPNPAVVMPAPSDQLAELGDLLAAAAAGGAGGIAAGGMAPRRPDSFRNLDELNQYLADMRQFYSMLGRPR